MSVVAFAEALEIVLEHARGLPVRAAEQIALLDAAGRVLAEDVTADRDQPPFHRSTRDGFAVRAADFTASAQLKIVGQVRAGEAWCGDAMQPGCAIEIMTGAPMPDGADAVAMIEHVALADGNVWAAAGRTLRAGENVVPQGSEARAGEVVLAAGSVIGAAEIAMSAACGRAELMVRSRPSVTIIATGDELVELGEDPDRSRSGTRTVTRWPHWLRRREDARTGRRSLEIRVKMSGRGSRKEGVAICCCCLVAFRQGSTTWWRRRWRSSAQNFSLQE